VTARRWAQGPKLTPKIILEGTRLTHKTDLAFALNEHPRITGPRRYRYHAPLVSAEWCAFTPYPWGRGIIDYESAERDLAMETVVGRSARSGSVHVHAAPWCLPTAPWRAASTRSGSPKISMNPTAAAWSNASPSS
jgi:hypothetical protein